MTTKERYQEVIAWFEQNMPEADTELHFGSTFQLLVAVMLSAQCTDKRVNTITPALFEKYPTADKMAEASPEELFSYIKSVSYPNSKAKHLAETARRLVKDFGGNVPTSFDDLITLPGVGRKTANVMEAVAFGNAAMPVDTHVFRVANRLGLANATTPLATEKELVRHIPSSLLSKAHHWLLLHGRYVCKAQKPTCTTCGLRKWCKHPVL